MKKIFSIFTLAFLASVSTANAQYAGDALRFSQSNYGSTARFKAMGNAQIGVGGDMSSLSGNPAGLGLFTRSELTFTPELNISNVNSNYLQNNISTTKNQLNGNQFGAVFYMPSIRFDNKQSAQKGLVSGVFGVGYSRNNNYGMEVNYGGQNNLNTYRSYLSELANNDGLTPTDIGKNSLTGMGYHSYLINYNEPDETLKYSAISGGNPFISNLQHKNEIRNGSVSELNFAGALNISNQIYIGASIGLVSAKYIKDSEFTETGTLNPWDNASNSYTGVENYKLTYQSSQETKGSGVNARLGVIFRPDPSFRIGATLQTPTWFTIEDNFSENLSNRLSNDDFNYKPAEYYFTYDLQTPLKASLGAMYIIGGQGLISADVDFIDYSSIKFSTSEDSNDYSTINANNKTVRKEYKSAINYRLGAEYKLNQVSLRLGYGMNGSPYKIDPSKLFDTYMYSGGLGYKVNQYYFDFAYQRIESNYTNSAYTLNNGTEPLSISKITNNNFYLTFGIKF